MIAEAVGRAIIFKPEKWADECANEIHKLVMLVIEVKGQCNVMLTGGTSARRVYKSLNSLFDQCLLEHINFYFGDERCVPESHLDSNYHTVISSLFQNNKPKKIFRIKSDSSNLDLELKRYSKIIPSTIDLLILSVGLDGHIASLFPHSNLLDEYFENIGVSESINHPYKRLTITPKVIDSAEMIFALAPGDKRASFFYNLNDVSKYEVPAKLIANAVWCLDVLQH